MQRCVVAAETALKRASTIKLYALMRICTVFGMGALNLLIFFRNGLSTINPSKLREESTAHAHEINSPEAASSILSVDNNIARICLKQLLLWQKENQLDELMIFLKLKITNKLLQFDR
jgi:hypothetical protein